MTVAGRFVKKPVEVEAVQFEHVDQAALVVAWVEGSDHLGGAVFIPAQAPYDDGVHGTEGNPPHIMLGTLHGATTVNLGDWIVRGPGGDYWPNTPEEFARNYAPAS